MAVVSQATVAEDPPIPSDALIGLVDLSDDQLREADIATLNLMAARSLPGAENLDVKKCLRVLDQWTRLVRMNTKDWLPGFKRTPRRFGRSPGQFRMTAMITVLQRSLGVRYNLSFNEGEYNGTDSRNLFIHGLLGGRGGTCVSMPVLYTAIGRRLGYPLKLVETKEHLFARWDDPEGERFNIECTSRGFLSYDDAHHRQHPWPVTEDEVRNGIFLKSLEPREELSLFLQLRATCLRDNLRFADALEVYYHAHQLAPKMPGVGGHWGVVTLLYQSVHPTPTGFEVRWPRATEKWQQEMIPVAKKTLHRIFKIHGIREAKS